MPSLVLASGSPRRQAFLTALGLAFTVDAAQIDESALPGEAPEDLVCRLSRGKALTVASRHPAGVVLAADTVVVLAGQILGKPGNGDEAFAMLAALRSRSHEVYTAVSVAAAGAVATAVCCSEVWMRAYGDDEIRAYVATGDPLDKAGAYAIQHPVFAPVAAWDGCYAGIMGLPLGLAADLLGAAGITLLRPVVSAVCEQASGNGRCCLRRTPPGC